MTFDYHYEPGEYDLMHSGSDDSSIRESTEVQQATEHLASSASQLATEAAQLIESVSGLMTSHLDDESHGAFSDFNASLRDSVVGINESAQHLRRSTTVEEVRPYTDYIQQRCALTAEDTARTEQIVERLPEDVTRDHPQIPPGCDQVRGLLAAVSDAATTVFDWWQHFTAQRPPVDLRDAEQVESQSDEQINSRGHWRDMANSAPAGSVGSLIKPMADPLYAVVGEIAGEGMGATFEGNAELFNQVNETPKDMAAAVIAWAKYETLAIQTNPATSVAARAAGLLLTETDRAKILWTSYRSLNESADLPVDPYEAAGAELPESQQVYERTRWD